jgi:hypothetical protein
MPGTIGDARKRRDPRAPDSTRVPRATTFDFATAAGIHAGDRVRVHRLGHPTIWATLVGYVIDAETGVVIGVRISYDDHVVFVPWHAVTGLESV